MQSRKKAGVYSTTELAGCNIKQLMPSPYREQHDGYLANYRETGKKTIIGIGREVVGKRKDGSVFPLHLSVSEFKFADKRMFAGFVRDLSERNRTEADLQLQKQALETGATALTIADANGNISYVNQAFLKMWGYEHKEDIVGRPITDLSSSEEDYGEVLKGLREQREWIGERIAKKADGTLFEIQLSASLVADENGKPVASMASFVDISELKSVERALRIQQRAVESATNGVLITDPSQADNPIIYVNAAMERMSGYTSEEVLGKNCRFLQGADSEQEAVVELRTAIKEQRQCKVLLRNYRKDGTLFWNELTVSPVRSESGNLTHFVGIQSDVTERKKSEEALEHLHNELELRVEERTRQLHSTQEQLVRREKLATLGQLAGGVAHEIRNPLGVIRNAVYFLQQIRSFGDQDVTDALGEISRGLSNSERIVSELLDYARGRQSELSIFPLGEAIDAALDTVKVPKTVSVARPAPSGIHINADRGQIERLFSTLFQNAIQAMPDGGA